MEHKEVKARLRSISSLQGFNSLLNSTTLSDEDKRILYLVYIQDKPLGYIADIMGYSESYIKKRHCNCLRLIGNVMDD